jgi:hypothetical protein
MSLVALQMKQHLEDGDFTLEEAEECAKKVMELREEYPEAWSIMALADDEVLRRFVE